MHNAHSPQIGNNQVRSLGTHNRKTTHFFFCPFTQWNISKQSTVQISDSSVEIYFHRSFRRFWFWFTIFNCFLFSSFLLVYYTVYIQLFNSICLFFFCFVRVFVYNTELCKQFVKCKYFWEIRILLFILLELLSTMQLKTVIKTTALLFIIKSNKIRVIFFCFTINSNNRLQFRYVRYYDRNWLHWFIENIFFFIKNSVFFVVAITMICDRLRAFPIASVIIETRLNNNWMNKVNNDDDNDHTIL